MKKTLLSMTLLSSLTAGYAVAEEPSFHYIEGGYTDIEDSTGFTLRGNLELNDNFYLTGAYTDVSDDETFILELDQRLVRVGGGFKAPISDTTAFYAELNYIELENEYGSSSDSEDGHQAGIGLRSMISDSTEVYGELTNQKFVNNVTLVTVGGRQYFNENIGVFAEYTRDDYENNGYNIGVSYKF